MSSAPKKRNWWPFVVQEGSPEDVAAPKTEARIRVNRPTRIPFDPIRGARLTLNFTGHPPIKCEVTNLSSHGLGLAVSEVSPHTIVAGSTIPGEIEFGTFRFGVSIRAVHVTRGVAGCIFTNRNELYIQAFSKWFAAEIAAARLRRMNQLILKEEPDGKPIYYFGDGNELFIVESIARKPGEHPKLLRFHAMVLGNYFEAEEGRRLKYGHAFIDARMGDTLAYKGSELIRYSSEVPQEMTELFGRFVESIGDLESWHKIALLAILSSRSSLD